MDTIGLDLHKRESRLCMGHDHGTIEERRIATTRERFTTVLGERPRTRILLEASTEMEARRLGAYRVAHRLLDARWDVRAELAVREAFVRTRTRYVALAKALVRRDGLRVPRSESHLVAQRIAALEVSESLAGELQPLFEILAPLNEQIAAADRRLVTLTQSDPTRRAPHHSPVDWPDHRDRDRGHRR